MPVLGQQPWPRAGHLGRQPLEVPDQVVRERILSRRLRSKCGVDYNLISSRPAVAGSVTCAAAGWWLGPTSTPAWVRP